MTVCALCARVVSSRSIEAWTRCTRRVARTSLSRSLSSQSPRRLAHSSQFGSFASSAYTGRSCMCANVCGVSSALCPRPLARDRDAPCPSRHRVFALGGDAGGLSGGVAARSDARRIASYSSSDFNSMVRWAFFLYLVASRALRRADKRTNESVNQSINRSVGHRLHAAASAPMMTRSESDRSHATRRGARTTRARERTTIKRSIDRTRSRARSSTRATRTSRRARAVCRARGASARSRVPFYDTTYIRVHSITLR